MLPINDFNFVVAGFATFAATVGYACTRRLSASFVGSDSDGMRNAIRDQSKVDVDHQHESVLVVEKLPEVVQVKPEYECSAAISPKPSKENLKRKVPHDGFEEPEKPVKSDFGYPHNLAHIYPPPNKRIKTPPTADDNAPIPVEILPTPMTEIVESALTTKDPEPAVVILTREPPPPPPQVASPSPPPQVASPPPPTHSPPPQVASPPPQVASPPLQVDSPAPPPPQVDSPAPPQAASPPPPPLIAPAVLSHTLFKTPTPSSYHIPIPAPTFRQPLRNTIIAPVPAIPKSFGNSSFSGGFAAFAGSKTPFSTFGGNTSLSTPKPGRSIWSAAPSDLASHQNDEAANIIKDSDLFRPGSPSIPVLEETKPSAPVPSSKQHLTGEENEDVQMDLKGVKLYVKRGKKPYGEGILGHLKLLCDRTSLEERILFRREPLWKVSMNVRVQPTVRCAFVPEENALKFILKENVESSMADSPEQELVIYVLKPGRSCSKQGFEEFALAVSENAHFRSSKAS